MATSAPSNDIDTPTPGAIERPAYHFTPLTGWMNDPNGLVYVEGEYHLFYQHLFPAHWGHAVSTDLLHWTHLPIALAPDERGFIASGCAVVDEHDTSGFFGGGAGPVAIFTHWGNDLQDQSIAYSTDRGRTWTKYAGNPVVPSPGIRDFRDPKVLWHVPTERWVMVLAVYDRLHFYVSPNLTDWTFASEFGAEEGSHDGVWECPDLVELPVENLAGETRWTLHVSVNATTGRTMQYFVGDFDGTRFTNDNDPGLTLWTDHGADFYAAVTWSSLPPGDGRRLWVGWLNNWTYAKVVPSQPWQGAMSVPRELGLAGTSQGIRLVQRPAAELTGLRHSEEPWADEVVRPGVNLLAGVRGRSLEIVAEIEPRGAAAVELAVRVGADERTTIRYEPAGARLTVDRRDSDYLPFSPTFKDEHIIELDGGDILSLRVFLDECSVEVFAGDGRSVISDLIFPDRASDGCELLAEGGDAFVRSLVVYRLCM